MYYDLTVPQFTKMLQNLDKLMEKAQTYADAKKFDTEVFMNYRMAPDMFPFTRQVQIACDTAKLCVSRLTGKDAPVYEDNEKTFAELRTRIKNTIGYMNDFSKNDFNAAAEKKITQPRWEGKWMTGHEYLIQHAIPNVYFHTTAAYMILRHNGVEVGKKDFLGEMPYKM